MKTKLLIIILAFSTLISSCGEIKKEIAGDQLVGTYSGKATFIYKHSEHNVGIEDETKESSGTISIYKNSENIMFIKTGDGNLKITGITLASNGTTFNISYQNVVQKDGKINKVFGIQAAELDGRKYDGIFLTDQNLLNFGYETVVKYNYWGTIAEVNVICIYEFSKLY